MTSVAMFLYLPGSTSVMTMECCLRIYFQSSLVQVQLPVGSSVAQVTRYTAGSCLCLAAEQFNGCIWMRLAVGEGSARERDGGTSIRADPERMASGGCLR